MRKSLQNYTNHPVPILTSRRIDLYWKEYCNFDKKNSVFEKQANFFQTFDAGNSHSHLWHELDSFPFTKFLVTLHAGQTQNGKWLGVGSAEQSWGDVKQIKDRKSSNLGGASLEKQAILFNSAKLNKAIIRCTYSENNDNNDKFFYDNKLQ